MYLLNKHYLRLQKMKQDWAQTSKIREYLIIIIILSYQRGKQSLN